MQDGKSAEVGMVGKDGVAGLPALFGSRPAVHSLSVAIGGSALRLRKSDLEEELKCEAGLQRIIVPYVTDYVTQVAQRAACAILHHMEQRFAVWLLMITDRLDTNSVETTQERMAQYLGVRRAGVTVIARELQFMGAISYTRGQPAHCESEATGKSGVRMLRRACSTTCQTSYSYSSRSTCPSRGL